MHSFAKFVTLFLAGADAVALGSPFTATPITSSVNTGSPANVSAGNFDGCASLTSAGFSVSCSTVAAAPSHASGFPKPVSHAIKRPDCYLDISGSFMESIDQNRYTKNLPVKPTKLPCWTVGATNSTKPWFSTGSWGIPSGTESKVPPATIPPETLTTLIEGEVFSTPIVQPSSIVAYTNLPISTTVGDIPFFTDSDDSPGPTLTDDPITGVPIAGPTSVSGIYPPVISNRTISFSGTGTGITSHSHVWTPLVSTVIRY
ncbi:uncharacterized protein BDR25DRAFT_387006 [Lindgomyces ingoldianus]|uniref:Uncharacterized protein n=1 Tax=Lindgomyces ingoldianus TaxID=673940 RepID=A0ACB6Q7L9_9PLEO|nr:uncharacterized protein BDR25DRAFT_387006 [Lindgomyces ingoldianus]KAF2462593.1 hypothetical protein BDR25DRAFT_387006 [Lindgomyces ingoldianus]